MPSTTASADPIRTEVERRLNEVADALVSRPFERVARLGGLAHWPCRVIRTRLAEPIAVVRSFAELALRGGAQPSAGSRPVAPRAAAPPPPEPEGGSEPAAVEHPPVDELPIAGYESLAASQVVARLDDLTPSELARVRAFEATHRGRRTVLGKIDHLLAARSDAPRAMIDPVVRLARSSDAAALSLLETEARTGLVEARGGSRWLEEHPEIGPGWADAVGSRIVLTAELDGHVVGYMVLDVDGAIAHVDQVYVTPGARELGFGDGLLEAATDRARRAGATVLEGHALPGDRETKNLYERAGITARLITVSRRL